MTHLSLFSGIGGLDIAAEWAGFETVGQCEMADYPTKILEKHWPDVPRWRDIRTLTKEDFFERTGLRTVDVISGGFPCQPFSVAGKQKGREDDRYLWPEMRRVIAELAPRWVVGENVPGILRIAAADIVQDLESIGYHVILFDFEAASVGAPHHRERIAFIANRNDDGQPAAEERGSLEKGGGGSAEGKKPSGQSSGLRSAGEFEDVADTNRGELRHDFNHGRPTVGEKHALANAGDAGRTETHLADTVRFGSTAGVADQKTGKKGHAAKLIYSSKTIRNTMRRLCRRKHGGENHRDLRTDVAGQLNPTWVEWLMGFPIGWTELKD